MGVGGGYWLVGLLLFGWLGFFCLLLLFSKAVILLKNAEVKICIVEVVKYFLMAC